MAWPPQSERSVRDGHEAQDQGMEAPPVGIAASGGAASEPARTTRGVNAVVPWNRLQGIVSVLAGGCQCVAGLPQSSAREVSRGTQAGCRLRTPRGAADWIDLPERDETTAASSVGVTREAVKALDVDGTQRSGHMMAVSSVALWTL
jgi:hypothetical protein